MDLTLRDIALMAVCGIGVGLAANHVGAMFRDLRTVQQASTPRDAEQARLEAEFEAALRELRRLEVEEHLAAAVTAPSVSPPQLSPVEALRYARVRAATDYTDAKAGYAMPPEPRPIVQQRRPAAETEYPYRGLSGARYRYDLGNPMDAMQYSVDPMSQLQDSISVDPRREIDRGMGQPGAGIEP